ncbi:hypothetical protein [Paraliomyxa miuraensis]|uniref:hypothetical protein n=1 Tax=Paraliomyxa miuraensis TaxID=376150 RepID=UPI00225BEEC1|nr:hypothetical protein [Paraliomyxa miuraensis]MCX4239630.1 hypothetical protein [Paraliomyxa miuraensis]
MRLGQGLVARGLAVVLALGIAMPAAAAPTAGGRASEGTELRAALVIDTSALGDGGPSMTDVLSRLEQDVLRERGVQPAASEADPRIVVVVRPLAQGAGVFDNRVDVTIEHGGEPWPDASWGFDCPRCSDGHLLNKVGVTLHSAVTRLEEEARAAEPTSSEPAAASEPAEPEPEAAGDDTKENPKLGPLVWAGGATAVAGVVGLAVGVPLALREDTIIGDLNSPTRQGYQTRTPGWTVTAIGGAALVAGGALLAVGLIRWSREKKQLRTATTALTPWVSGERMGLSLQGRF